MRARIKRKKAYRPFEAALFRSIPAEGFTPANVTFACNLVTDLCGQGDYDVGPELGALELHAFCARMLKGAPTDEDHQRVEKLMAAAGVDLALISKAIVDCDARWNRQEGKALN
jgi:hypothetical protein